MALIYIVEDDTSIREIEMIALKNSNYMVQGFDRASTFYKKLEEILPDLILLDIMLPDEDGYKIVRKIRSHPRTKRIPVMMITAKTTEMDMVKGLDDGADDYIRKPFENAHPIMRIKDTGIGIPADQQDRVFERFYRVDKSRSRETGGTGLGLAIVKHIADIHAAEISLNSVLGEGTEIIIRF